MKRIRFFLALICALTLFPAFCSANPFDSSLSSGQPHVRGVVNATIPFELVGHLIIVKGSVDGSGPDYTFVLDTGSITAVNTRLADRLGLKMEGTCKARGATGAGDKVCITRLKSLALGGFEARDISAVVFDPHFEQRAGISIDGFIGSNFLRFFKVRIDYQKKLVTLSNDTAPMTSVPGGTIVNIDKDGKNAFVPQVELRCGDARVQALIDTGLYDPMSIPGAFLDRSNVDAEVNGDGAMGSGNFGNMDRARMVRLKEMSMGPLRIGKVVATSQSGQTYALIGYGLLSNFTITIDYPAGRMLLVPSEGGRRMDNLFSTGMAIGRDYGGKTILYGLWKPSPAGSAGLAPGDEITVVDGRPASSYTLTGLQKLLFDDAIPDIRLSIKEPFGEKNFTRGKKCLFEMSKAVIRSHGRGPCGPPPQHPLPGGRG